MNSVSVGITRTRGYGCTGRRSGSNQWLLRRSVRLVVLFYQRRRQRRALLELDRRMLDDIGVSAQQARQESRKPFWRA